MKNCDYKTGKRIISITGTPGTGKTTLAKKLAQKLNAEIINLTGIVNKNNLYAGIDKERDAKIVDEFQLKKFVVNLIETKFPDSENIIDAKIVDEFQLKKFVVNLIETKFPDSENIIIEGLLSHFMPATHIIVLRTSPGVLKKRLELRGYSKAKVKENLDAEFLGVCLEESLWCKNILELDTTGNVNLNLILNWLKEGGRIIKEIDRAEDFCEVLGEF